MDRLDEITGAGVTAAHLMIAEIGVDMSRFPTAAHLCSWARFAPGVNESAGKEKGSGATGHGNPYLAAVLGEVAVAAGKTDTFLGERYRRIARRRGKKKAIVASAVLSWFAEHAHLAALALQARGGNPGATAPPPAHPIGPGAWSKKRRPTPPSPVRRWLAMPRRRSRRAGLHVG